MTRIIISIGSGISGAGIAATVLGITLVGAIGQLIMSIWPLALVAVAIGYFLKPSRGLLIILVAFALAVLFLMWLMGQAQLSGVL